ncbi:hypothetical protein ACFL6S_27510 [Candidatus Poribacteria bacterium]
MRIKKIAIRYSILLWFAVVFMAYYVAYIDRFSLRGIGRMSATRLLDFVRELVGKIF